MSDGREWTINVCPECREKHFSAGRSAFCGGPSEREGHTVVEMESISSLVKRTGDFSIGTNSSR